MSPPTVHHDGLQALRGLLAMGVFFQHLFWMSSTVTPGPIDYLYALNWGGLGVFGFFALSGYLITGKADDAPLKFLQDRLRRIFPLFWLSVVIAMVATYVESGYLMPVPWDVMVLNPNGRLNTVPLPHWSLYFECFFYGLVLLVALARVSWVKPAVLAWGAIALVLYTRPYAFANYSAPNVYNLVFPLFGVFFAAGIVAGWRFVPTPRAAPYYAAGALVMIYFLPLMAWAGWYHFIPSLLSSHGDLGFEFMAIGAFCGVRAALCWRPAGMAGRTLAKLGDASYGIYMMHMVCMGLAVALIKRYAQIDSYWAAMAIIFALALPPAYLYGRLDVRMQRALKQWQWRRRPVASAAPHRAPGAAG